MQKNLPHYPKQKEDLRLVETDSTPIPSLFSRTISRITLGVIARIIGPLTYFEFPKFAFKQMIVYNNLSLKELLRKYSQGREEISLEKQDGQPLETFFVSEDGSKQGHCENVTVFSEKDPKELFPYLFDPDYKTQIMAKRNGSR